MNINHTIARDIISLCKQPSTTALSSFLKQSFTNSKPLSLKNFESLYLTLTY